MSSLNASENVGYFERLQQRNNKPETQQTYFVAIEKEYAKFLQTKDPKDLKRVTNDEWRNLGGIITHFPSDWLE